jgi:hypothetical protein
VLAAAGATAKPRNTGFSREIGADLLPFPPMPSSNTPYQVHSEARGPHWVAWITREGSTKPDRSILLVAASQAEAESRARKWAEQTRY